MLKRARAVAKREKIILEVGADMIDGAGHHGTSQTWGSDIDAANHAIELLRPFVSLASTCYFLLGTPAHVGNLSEWDNYIAKEFGYRAKYHHRVTIGNKLFDFAHHCTLPKDARNHEAALERQASQICRDYRKAGEPLPHFILRHHVHRHAVAYSGGVTIATNYGWKLRDDHVAKFSPLGLYAVGGLLIDTETLDIERLCYEGTEDKITHYQK
jgi:hypothetical protein